MKSSRSYPLLLAALIAGGGTAGYLLGRPVPLKKEASASAATLPAAAMAAKDSSGETSSKAEAMAVMEKLKADDPTDRDTGKQLAAWEKIRGFTIAQCLAALDANGEKALAVTTNAERKANATAIPKRRRCG